MTITVSWSTVITAAAVSGAFVALATYITKIVHWVDRQKAQDTELKALKKTHDDDINTIKDEQTLLTYGVLACLKGLQEKGCNGPVSDAIQKIEKHLNQKAHE